MYALWATAFNDWNSYTEVEIWGGTADGGGGTLDPAKPLRATLT